MTGTGRLERNIINPMMRYLNELINESGIRKDEAKELQRVLEYAKEDLQSSVMLAHVDDASITNATGDLGLFADKPGYITCGNLFEKREIVKALTKGLADFKLTKEGKRNGVQVGHLEDLIAWFKEHVDPVAHNYYSRKNQLFKPLFELRVVMAMEQEIDKSLQQGNSNGWGEYEETSYRYQLKSGNSFETTVIEKLKGAISLSSQDAYFKSHLCDPLKTLSSDFCKDEGDINEVIAKYKKGYDSASSSITNRP